jgi:hypothetical protein
MPLIRRNWDAVDADEWRREDWITIVISPIAYVLLMLGTALSFLLLPIGFVVLGAGIVLTALMHWVIDPKLKAVSVEYEKRQEAYLAELERNVRWEQDA